MYETAKAASGQDVVPVPPITIQHQRSQALAKEIHEAIAQLESRLETATAPKEPVTSDSGRVLHAVADDPCCELHSQLIQFNGELDNALRRIHNLRERVRL